MGKNLPNQRRGRGTSPTYRSPSHRHPGPVEYPHLRGDGVVKDIFQAPGHTAPLARVQYGGQEGLTMAWDGPAGGEPGTIGSADVGPGDALALGPMVTPWPPWPSRGLTTSSSRRSKAASRAASTSRSYVTIDGSSGVPSGPASLDASTITWAGQAVIGRADTGPPGGGLGQRPDRLEQHRRRVDRLG